MNHVPTRPTEFASASLLLTMNNLACDLEAVNIETPSSQNSTDTATQTRCQLMSLPNELLLQIIQYSRPNGFQAFLMACRRFYHVGHHLISEHLYCTDWRNSLRGDDYDVFYLLGKLKNQFIDIRPTLLDYLTSSQVRHRSSGFTTPREEYNLLQELYEEDGWLCLQLVEVITRIRASSVSPNTKKTQLASPNGPLPDFETWLKLCWRRDCIHQMIVPLLCPHTERLTLLTVRHSYYGHEKNDCLPNHLNIMESQRWPFLRELRITRDIPQWWCKELAPQVTPKQISRVLKMTSLEILDVDGLRVSEEDDCSTPESLQTLSDLTLHQGMKHLRLDCVTLTPAHWRQLFSKVRNLKSLALDFHGLFMDAYRPDAHPYRQQKWMAKVGRLIDGNVTTPGGHRPPIINFQAVMDGIQAATGDTITHLAIMFFWMNHQSPVVPPHMQIIGFKGLPRLVHLEIDLRLVQPVELSLQPEVNFRPLTDVLPKSIETVRILLCRSIHTKLALTQLVGDTNSLKKTCPKLSKLVIVSQQLGKRKRSDHLKVSNELTWLWTELRKLDIEVIQNVIPHKQWYRLGLPGLPWRQQEYVGEDG